MRVSGANNLALVIIDTDILIDAMRGDGAAISRLQNLQQQYTLAISAVTQMELIVGCRDKRELQALAKFLRRFLILKITEGISDKAVELLQTYRLSHGLLIPDALIAATAFEYNEALITKNQRDFRFITNLNLLSYP